MDVLTNVTEQISDRMITHNTGVNITNERSKLCLRPQKAASLTSIRISLLDRKSALKLHTIGTAMMSKDRVPYQRPFF